MPRNIKISQRQYRFLCETTEDNFTFQSNDDTKPFDAQLNISTNGKTEDGEENPKKNTTSDTQGAIETPQGYNRYRCYGNISHVMREGVNANQADDIGEVDSFDNPELNTSTNNTNNDLVKIPQGVQDKINILLDTDKKANLSPKQNATVLNKLIDGLRNSSFSSYNIQKERDKKIQKYKNIPYQWRKELHNKAD